MKNMKNIKFIFGFVLLLAVTISCSIPDGISSDTALSGVASSNVAKIFDISTDNSGNVKITPTGNGVTSFTVNYGHGTGASASVVVAPGGSTSHSYPEGNYTVSIVSTDVAGNQTTATYPLVVTYVAPTSLTVNTGGDMTVSATANYAKSFLVYYGDVANEVGTPMAIGQTLPAHIYPGTGAPFTLSVVALSGGVAKTTATKTLFGFPLDFENASINYFFGTFGGVGFDKVANPNASGLNTSATVGKYTKHAGDASWSGTYSPLDNPINFSYGKKIKVLVYNPSAANIGKMMNVELEWYVGDNTGNANPWGAAVRRPLTTSGAWEELVFDFSTNAAIPNSPLPRFTQLVLRFNDSADGTGEIIYVDNFRLTN